MSTTIYYFDPNTGAYRGSAQARETRTKRPIIPRSATTDQPPEADDNEAAVWRDGAWSVVPDYRGEPYLDPDGEDQMVESLGVDLGGKPDAGESEAAVFDGESWSVVPDYRGSEYWDADGEKQTVKKLGEEVPPEALLEPRPTDYHVVSDGAWEIDIDRLRDSKMREVTGAYNAAVAPVASPYPDYERETWGKQEQEAKAYQSAADAGEAPPDCPLLQRIADQRGLTLSDLVGRVLDNVATYEQTTGDATGIRQRLEGEITAAYDAGDVDALQAIGWPE